ncbi:hypothetical protein [Deinococcus humi]|uniref:Uncharacterized protein n=1 Tax=Deinococcus humi TaxID=662880 RepID=A0A7W8JXJ9_9DEIO|nr:hypothetical protein [Deinococcus humi]MBB5365082.1 hypothetical protein [Deinococcus humi]GGO39532.1 hypothetical protein GCM10008949_47800 [Deinococcus humi]
MNRTRWKRNLGLTAALLGTLAGAQTYSGPKAVVYIGDRWCRGGYCSGSVYNAFDEAMNKALTASGYVEAVRKEGAPLELAGGVTSVSGTGSVCLPIVGCLSGKTVRASMELTDTASGTVKWNESCEGTSGGVSTWGWWGGSVYLDSDEGKAVADCAGKLVQKLTASGVLTPYLGQTGAVKTVAAPATAPAPAAPPAAQASQPVEQLAGMLKTLAFADMNALFTSDPYNPVKVKELNAAATSATLASASRVQLKVTSTENAGAYQLIGVTYTLPGGQEKFVQLAVTADPGLNPRGGTRLLYLSAFNPLRTSTPALDGLSRNVETLLGDLHTALGLPGL